MCKPFASWQSLLDHVKAGRPVLYHAPLDPTPRSVRVYILNGEVRVFPRSGGDFDPFTADHRHLDRFRS